MRKHLTAGNKFECCESQSQSRCPHWACRQKIDVRYRNFCLSILHYLCQLTQMTAHKLSSQLKNFAGASRTVQQFTQDTQKTRALPLTDLALPFPASWQQELRVTHKYPSATPVSDRQSHSICDSWPCRCRKDAKRPSEPSSPQVCRHDLVSSIHLHHWRIFHARSAQL